MSGNNEGFQGRLRMQLCAAPMMKKLIPLLAAIVVPCLSAVGAEKPNVILIISDDQGFPDYSFMGHERIKTPHIDKMAK